MQSQVDLSPFLNNKAAALTGYSTANFDNHNGSYPAEYLPQGLLNEANIEYQLPNWSSPTGVNDNINCSGQTIELPRGRYHSFNFLGATDGTASETVNGEFVAIYESGETENLGFVVPPWWSRNPSDGPVTAPFLNQGYINANGSTHINGNVSRMFTFQHHLDNSKTLVSLILPNQTVASELNGVASIHIFAITLLSVNDTCLYSPERPLLNVQNVRSTTNFRTINQTEVQLVEVTVNNLAVSANSSDTSTWLIEPVQLSISSHSVHTVIPATINRLRGGDQVQVVVGIVNADGVNPGTVVDGVRVLVDGEALNGSWNILAGIPEYQYGDESLRTHESPEWFNSVKFGIFVHWGIYSVPAWTVSGTQYAEWYWYWQHNPANESSAVWSYHRETYGADFLYDMFFPNFTGSEWTAEGLLQFVQDSGAKYYVRTKFVITSKHHDGFALFDTGNSSYRNSLTYGPKRDLIGELTNATKAHNARYADFPDRHIYHGLYFSLPEWFNPAYAKYGFAGGGDDLYHRRSNDPNNPGFNILQRVGWAGGLAKNAYNETAPPEPYTGYVEVDDYLQDIMKPQMEALMYKYNMDICGVILGDQRRTTKLNPEYALTSHVKTRKWESNEGSDPFSYGYNRDTPFNKYRNATYILHSLIDIVSKNGNYLLDVGPTANGTIVQPSRDSLLAVGNWLKVAGDAIYDTQYWYVAAEEGNLRFTTKPDAFYIISLTFPINGTVRSSLPVPVKEGDTVTFLGSDGSNTTALEWHWTDDNVFELFTDETELKKVDNAWAFKILGRAADPDLILVAQK
ncbi:hypothetical protein VNI00_006566 [Paramarasmius palmivorus]|uniref:alpha-L-fucosidase n=1 Tax=Paramarasmius palmivorus TaxID=297713 RepID=A0AAW0D702_9AGAR